MFSGFVDIANIISGVIKGSVRIQVPHLILTYKTFSLIV